MLTREKIGKLFVTAIAIIVVAFALIALATHLSGCTSWNYDRSEYDPNGVLISSVTVNGKSFLTNSNVDNVSVKIEGEYRSLIIGSFNRTPDSNSVKALSEGVVTGIGSVVVP